MKNILLTSFLAIVTTATFAKSEIKTNKVKKIESKKTVGHVDAFKFQLGLGYQTMDEVQVDDESQKLDDNAVQTVPFDFMFSKGYRGSKYISFSTGLGLSSGSGDEEKNSGENSYNVSTTYLKSEVTQKLFLNLSEDSLALKPYMGVGIGYGSLKREANSKSGIKMGSIIYSGLHTSFSAGIEVPFSERWFFDLGYSAQKLHVSKVKTDDSSSDIEKNFNLVGKKYSLQFGYLF
jgi:outer membrane protein W